MLRYRLCLVAIVVTWTSSCSSSTKVCAPGQQISCACPGGGTGAQVCSADGTSYGTCTGCSTSNNDGGGGGDAGGGADAGVPDAGPACHPPTTLNPPQNPPRDLYCPFSGDGGPDVYCNISVEHCCGAPAGSQSACTALATACPSGAGAVDWVCADQAIDCGAKNSNFPVCCAAGASVVVVDAGCANYATGFTGTQCVATGACSGISLCTSDGECPAGQHCIPFLTHGNAVGGCL